MAGVEPYAPCPCGSGQKFKWCCHKVESFVDKAQRLFDNGQVDSAIKVLDEGARKEPGNPWLLTRKAIMQIREGRPEPAKATLRQVLQKNPKHFGALVLLTRCVLETEGPVNGAGMFQEVLSSVDDSQRKQLAPLARIVATLLVEGRIFSAAIKHFGLVSQLDESADPSNSSLRQIQASPSVSPWMKDPLELAPPPAHLDGDSRGRFERALELASRGHWAPAAAGFDSIAGQDPGGEADYNLGLCRLWLGDEPGAIGPIRRRIARLGRSTEAVDLEVLCQLIEPILPDDRVEQIQLTWPLRDREALLAALRSKDDVHDAGPMSVDPADEESPEADSFSLLDRRRIDRHDGRGLTLEEVPRILGRVLVGRDVAVLETFDDGRVDSLGDRFTAMAGAAIAPAHPRTRVIGEEARSTLSLYWEWLYPAGLEPEQAERLEREQKARILGEVWPATPMPYLRFRTPEKAARDGDAEVPLRAALCQYELNTDIDFDFKALRARLGLEPEPAIDPAADLDRVPLPRLGWVELEGLDDDRLVQIYRRARRGMLIRVMEEAARAIVARPSLFEQGKVDPISVHSDLASQAASRGNLAEALSWIARGRQADSPTRRGPNAPLWDMIEVRLKARSERPEAWVPELAVVLERYSQEPAANQVLLMNLVEMGLVHVGPNPDDPRDILLDSRPLQALMAEYGPRVTTASGRLGVSATKPDLWTPGGPASGSGGALWTPGSAAGNSNPGDKPKLILPGR